MPNELEIGIVQLLKLNGVTSLKPDLRIWLKKCQIHLVWVALQSLFPESLLQDFLLWLEAAHLLHP